MNYCWILMLLEKAKPEREYLHIWYYRRKLKGDFYEVGGEMEFNLCLQNNERQNPEFFPLFLCDGFSRIHIFVIVEWMKRVIMVISFEIILCFCLKDICQSQVEAALIKESRNCHRNWTGDVGYDVHLLASIFISGCFVSYLCITFY